MNLPSEYTASVKFTGVHECFFIVPKQWRQVFSDELHVFKVQYGKTELKEAYLSCGKDMSHKSDIQSKVFINQKYGNLLGLKEREWVKLIPYTDTVPKAERVIIEPMTPDDWEIMELNPQFIEKDLINKIRIVWSGQVFPIWVNNSCIAVKVVTCVPEHVPVLLCEFSFISIVPKGRYVFDTHRETKPLKQKEKYNSLQFKHLRYCPETQQTSHSNITENLKNSDYLSSDQLSLSYYMPSLLSSWFASDNEEKHSLDSADENLSGDFEDFCPFIFDSVLRVYPFTNPESSLDVAVQATTVFISAATYVNCCGAAKEIPPCFIAVMQKLLVPERKKKKAIEGLRDNGSSRSLLPEESTPAKHSEKDWQETFESVCVTVMVIKSKDEDEYHVPKSLFIHKNAVVVPRELKRALNLQVPSVVHLKSVVSRPFSSCKIILHPVSDVDQRIDFKKTQEAFTQWAFGKKNRTYVISDGTLAKLKINYKKLDFFMQLQPKDKSSKSGNYSGSFISSDSDKSDSTQQECRYIILDANALKKVSLEIGLRMCITITTERPYLSKENHLFQDVKALKLEQLGGVEQLATKMIEDIEFWLKLRPLSYVSNHSSTFCGCILISGPKGVGKTAFASAVCKKFASYPYHVFVQTIQCIPFKGKRVEAISKLWYDAVSEAIFNQPSIILFEDLDYIASCPVSQEQENGPDGTYFASISQAFIVMMNRIIDSESKVAVIATSQSLHSLHSSLVNTRGRHVFRSIIEVTPPNAEQREEILKCMILQKPHVSNKSNLIISLNKIAAKTEGYVAQDLGTLVDRATHAEWIRLASVQKSDQIRLEMEDFEAALKSFLPASLRGISLQMFDVRTWNDVGGLKHVKKVIQQVIMWPTKYKQLYKNYSLKPQTNILLYGAPGTGKTLLAGVVAHECGLNFISIKGPELLSKYIGASEQAVRDLFKRAMTAKPCILFFDEFDSIAPRRGHDSTGVTDRVVNQLLTQLDGVESLEGVHVLAASSRPGLIDPALLRPGRLDKCLLCPLPDMEDRLEILKCLSAKLPLSNDIDFHAIASLTEHFSGADLQALLYTAHIDALHDAQSLSSRRYSTGSEDVAYSVASDKLLYLPSLEEGIKAPSYEEGKKIVQEVEIVQDRYFGIVQQRPRSHRNSLSVSISQRHLMKVASEMKPSVSAEERHRYEMVFKKFKNVLTGESSVHLEEKLQKVTLA